MREIISNSRKRNNGPAPVRRAFTFVEALITIGIFSIVILATQQFFVTGEKTWQRDIETVQLQQEARRMIDDIVKELRASTGLTITAVDSSSNKINFYPPGGSDVSYYVLSQSYGASQVVGQLIRDASLDETCDTAWNDNSCKVTGSYVDELFFCCWHDAGGGSQVCDAACTDSTRLEIKIRTQKTTRGAVVSYPVEDPGNNRYLKAVMRLRNE